MTAAKYLAIGLAIPVVLGIGVAIAAACLNR